MAVPADLHDAAEPALDRGPHGLIDRAVRLLVEHLDSPAGAGRPWRLGPLVIVSPREDAATTAVRTATQGGGARAVIIRTGEDLDREIAAAIAGERLERLGSALASCRLVVVDRIDRVSGDPHRHALTQLFDASTALGTTWCVSVPRLRDDELGPAVASRLSGGLVVTAPAAVPAAAGGMPALGRIVRAAARLHDVPIASIAGPERRRSVAAARSLAMYLARRLTGRSFQAIGAACGGRDHTTVLHGVRVCGSRIARDPAYAADVERIAAELAAHGPREDAGRCRTGVGSAPLRRALENRRRPRRRGA